MVEVRRAATCAVADLRGGVLGEYRVWAVVVGDAGWFWTECRWEGRRRMRWSQTRGRDLCVYWVSVGNRLGERCGRQRVVVRLPTDNRLDSLMWLLAGGRCSPAPDRDIATG
ncbi:peptidyl-tRNA hydrolase 2 [Striga asiatica]|uniref:Peptidyl-tRNA hydrolase 2 n=1 Tax=Striga asiatica TaxID=4170 RepID=A0A5A7QEH8_STRAF|nr:peptidyl-tRNA hydrolase 2 [Striga asiatica]